MLLFLRVIGKGLGIHTWEVFPYLAPNVEGGRGCTFASAEGREAIYPSVFLSDFQSPTPTWLRHAQPNSSTRRSNESGGALDQAGNNEGQDNSSSSSSFHHCYGVAARNFYNAGAAHEHRPVVFHDGTAARHRIRFTTAEESPPSEYSSMAFSGYTDPKSLHDFFDDLDDYQDDFKRTEFLPPTMNTGSGRNWTGGLNTQMKAWWSLSEPFRICFGVRTQQLRRQSKWHGSLDNANLAFDRSCAPEPPQT
ncbi:uncharacterized protein LOC135397913 [Ornithodoros turicata]|uniref:uncharacterized protein LOC135397913 n=1 Tax=Ornithodoros turicata TaxID=34597 RepID=UPI003139920F